jgi:cytochrome c oxidase subunit 2
VVATVLLRIGFGFMFQLPWPASTEELGKDLLYFLGFGWPETANAQAQQIDSMFNGHYWMISFLFALIMVIMLYSVVVFRRRPGDETDGPHVHGNTALEVGWTIIPTIVVIGFGVWGAFVMNDMTAPKEDEMVIRVTGRQWSWSFEYPEQEDIASAELILPVGQPVLLEMESEDVLHSFWVPEFRVKQDLVPGRTTELRITPTEVGDYKLRCAEICGLEHAAMLADVRVVSETEFVAWVDEALAAPAYAEMTPEERGEIWYANGEGFGCEACHSLDGSPGAGPSWLGLYQREEEMADGSLIVADEEYIRNSILNPNDQIVAGYNPNVMPAIYGDQFAELEAEILQEQGVEIDIIDDLIAFIKTLEE